MNSDPLLSVIAADGYKKNRKASMAYNGQGLALLGDLENVRPEPKLMRC
jgi:hypothetical protein